VLRTFYVSPTKRQWFSVFDILAKTYMQFPEKSD